MGSVISWIFSLWIFYWIGIVSKLPKRTIKMKIQQYAYSYGQILG